jgi:hypothetical protein
VSPVVLSCAVAGDLLAGGAELLRSRPGADAVLRSRSFGAQDSNHRPGPAGSFQAVSDPIFTIDVRVVHGTVRDLVALSVRSDRVCR